MKNYKLGDRVKVIGKKVKGEIVYIGETHFSDGVRYGIFLDESKGQNNGTLKGKCYFKCPRNHGIFVKASQIVKEYEDSDNENDKLANIPSKSRSIYPNYLKASSKIKHEKHLCPLNNDDVQQVTPEIKIERSPSPVLDTSVEKDLNLELQSVKQENEDLKNKLKESERRLKESIGKCTKAATEMEEMKKDLDCKKKQINVQKCHLRMLKMRQCNHYKNVDSLIGPKSVKSSKGDCASKSSTVDEGSQSISDDEFDQESLKALTSMRRIVELEEENRIMIEGLVELREFLKSHCQSLFMGIEIQPIKLKVKDSGSYPLNTIQRSSIFENNDFSSDESESQIKEYRNMLREMRKFSEIIKEKGKVRKDIDKHKSNMYPKESFIQNGKDQFSADDSINIQRNQSLDSSGLNISKGSKNQDSSRSVEEQKTNFEIDERDKKLFQMFGDQNAVKPFNFALKVKDSAYFNNKGENIPLDVPREKNKPFQVNKCDATVIEESKQYGTFAL